MNRGADSRMCLAECARPRAQKRRQSQSRSDNPTRWSAPTSLRPRTAALR